ncbi:MAG: phosphoribosylformylglycinamidine synthase subunit PurS [Rhizobacter sp.]|nr:phosphoribosylformylglycinamidine synthase subunit PurS [Chlorobiales bacterium]
MAYRAKIKITLRPSILDTQGKAVHHALESLNYQSVAGVRIGKYIELEVAESDESTASRITDEACKKLLANPVMEDYSFELEQIGQAN